MPGRPQVCALGEDNGPRTDPPPIPTLRGLPRDPQALAAPVKSPRVGSAWKPRGETGESTCRRAVSSTANELRMQDVLTRWLLCPLANNHRAISYPPLFIDILNSRLHNTNISSPFDSSAGRAEDCKCCSSLAISAQYPIIMFSKQCPLCLPTLSSLGQWEGEAVSLPGRLPLTEQHPE